MTQPSKCDASPSYIMKEHCEEEEEKEKEYMAKTSQIPRYVRVGNAITLTLLRAGVKLVGPFLFFGNYPMYLLTVRGRKSGQPRTVAIAIMERNGDAMLAPRMV